MNFLETSRFKSIFWLIVVSSWVLGFAFGRWIGINESLMELSKAVRVANPLYLDVWWKILAYFTLSTIAVFALSHILFGIGAGIFLFARGMYDTTLVAYLESTIGGWTISNIPMSEVYVSIIIILILGINLPLCLWSSQLGIQRSVYTLYRLRNEPINPKFGSEPLSNLAIILSISLVTGLVSTLVFSHL